MVMHKKAGVLPTPPSPPVLLPSATTMALLERNGVTSSVTLNTSGKGEHLRVQNVVVRKSVQQ